MAEIDVYAEADQAAASEKAFLDSIARVAQLLAGCELHRIRSRLRIDTEMFVSHMLVAFLHRRGASTGGLTRGPLRRRPPLTEASSLWICLD